MTEFEQRSRKLQEAAMQSAASRLGLFYESLRKQGRVPFHDGVLPKYLVGVETHLALDYAYNSSHLSFKKQQYKEDYASVIPLLEDKASRWAREMLDANRDQLLQLRSRLLEPQTGDALHKIAQRMGESTGGFNATREDYQEALNKRTAERGQYPFLTEFDLQLVEMELLSLRKKRLNEAVQAELADGSKESSHLDLREMSTAAARTEHAEMLAVLSLHPQALDLFAAYYQSPAKGSELAAKLVLSAAEDIRDFRNELLDSPDKVWRYAPLIIGGVTRLGLQSVYGFPQYAIAIGQVLSQSTAEKVFNHLGMVLLCVGLVFTGPVGAAVIGALDLALVGASGALAFVREREKALAAGASVFMQADERLSPGASYGQPLLAAASLLTGLFLLRGSASTLLSRSARDIQEMPLPSGKSFGNSSSQAAAVDLDPLMHTSSAASSNVSTGRVPANVASSNTPMTSTSSRMTSSRGTPSQPASRPPQLPGRGSRGRLPLIVKGGADPQTAGTGGIIYIHKRLPAGENVTEVVIEGQILESIPRQRFEERWREASMLPKEWGLKGYQRAHLWGPRFGDEAAEGIMYAPEQFNKSWEAIVENRIQELYQMTQVRGGEVWLKAVARSYDRTQYGGNCLASVEYFIEFRAPALPVHREYITLSVGTPPHGRVFDVAAETHHHPISWEHLKEQVSN